jgi:hypothetical protein
MKTKEVRGITIISLVVTIVVLLILAGVSVSLVIGNNNLFDKAKSTQKVQTIAGIKEALELEKADIQVEGKTVNLENYLEQISTGKKNYDLSSTEKLDDKNAYIIVNDQYKFLLKDKGNGDVEITYEGVAVSGDLTLSSYEETYTYPNSGIFTVTNNVSGGELSVESDAPNIATASLKKNTITVVPGTTAGKANIIVKSATNGDYAENKVIHVATVENGTISLSVTPYEGTYDGQAHNAITQVDVNPSDAKLEYSLDGNTYSETMPTITNTSSFTVTVKASKAGYKTQTTTETVKVNKANGNLTLSATSGTIAYPNNTSFTVSGNTGTLSVSSNNTNIATASISGNTVTVKPGTTAGKATITVTSAAATNYNAKSATYTATVQNGTISLSATPYSGTYDGKAHNALTKVSVNPSDAKLEYFINGGTYSTTMPTITNTSSFTVTVRASKAGYKTQTTTETVKVNKANGSLTLSSYSGTITCPNSTSFTASGTGSISAWSSNTGVATVTVSGNTIIVKSVGAGSATITVKSAASTNYNEKTATYTVTVKNPTFTEGSGVGYYADTDGDGTPDGIIFADFKNGGSGSWGGYSYTISTVTGLKEYYVSKTNYNGPFGTKNVLSARGSGNARFNVMALSDYNNSATYTFTNAKSITSGDWRTPTKEDLTMFAGQLVIKPSNYSGYGLKATYWSSTVYNGSSGYYVTFNNDFDIFISFNGKYPVRLARTF